jgi:hypothetical protein
MARTTFKIDIVAPAAPKVAKDYHDLGERFGNQEGGFERVNRTLEEAHRLHFRRLRGRYVRTGAVRASLTQSNANGAIRTIHANELKFGTRVEHARYLTKSPRDPEGGQIRKGDSGKGRSAVVVFPRRVQREVVRELTDWIMESVGE